MVGRNVVIRLAADDASTARNSRLFHGVPITGSASAPNTLSEISSLPRPRPSVPSPAYISAEIETSRYVSRIDTTQSRAARPGVFSASLDSSLTVSALSQPQNEKIDADKPAMKAVRVSPVNGLNQSQEKAMPVGSSGPPAFAKAMIENSSNTPSWKKTSTNCTFSVVVIPRYAMAVAPTRKIRHVPTLTNLFVHKSPRSGLLKILPRSW